jgi:hypothetical protein
MGLQRSIWKEIPWLNSFGPAVKIAGLIFGIALIVGAWYLGTEWWTTPVTFVVKGMARNPKPPLLEIVAVIVAIICIVYITYVIDRDGISR